MKNYNRNDFRVVVLGASLAGAAAAVVLGQAGILVTLIDKATFPRRKPCGEGLCSLGIKSLITLGVAPSAIPSWPYAAYEVLTRGREFRIEAPLRGIGIQRFDLDDLLLRRASEYPNVKVILGERPAVNDELIVSFGDGREPSIPANYVIVADGAGSKIAHSLGATEVRYGRSLNAASAMLKGVFAFDGDAIKVSVGDGFELYGTRVGRELLNLSVLSDVGNVSQAGELRRFFEDSAAARELCERMGFRGELVSRIEGRANIGNIRRELRSDNIILVGDAREEFDPCGGMGMTHALMSGMSAAESIIRRLNGDSYEAASKWRMAKERSFSDPMRTFTKISKGGLTTARRFPWMMGLVTSGLVRKTLLTFTKGL